MRTSTSREADFQKQCLRWAKSLPEVWLLKVVGSAVQSCGIPDIIMCVNGHFVAIELKRPNGKGVVSEIQQAQIEHIRQAGGRAEVVSSFDKFKEIVNDYRRI